MRTTRNCIHSCGCDWSILLARAHHLVHFLRVLHVDFRDILHVKPARFILLHLQIGFLGWRQKGCQRFWESERGRNMTYHRADHKSFPCKSPYNCTWCWIRSLDRRLIFFRRGIRTYAGLDPSLRDRKDFLPPWWTIFHFQSSRSRRLCHYSHWGHHQLQGWPPPGILQLVRLLNQTLYRMWTYECPSYRLLMMSVHTKAK